MEAFFIEVLKFFHIIGPSLWEQGYPNSTIIVYALSNKEELEIHNSVVIRRAVNARKEAFSKKRKAFVFTAIVDTHYLFDSCIHDRLYYLGPKIKCDLTEIYLL